MSTAKATLYATALDAARRLALFDTRYPTDVTGKLQPGGAETGQDWSELVRKFAKHNPGRQVTAQAALADQTLHALLTKAYAAAGYDGDRSHAKAQAVVGGKPTLQWPPLIRTDDRGTANNYLVALESAITRERGTASDVYAARVVHAIGLYYTGEFERALDELEAVDANSAGGEGYDATLRVVATCVQGFANERTGDARNALALYSLAGKLYTDVHGRIKSVEADRAIEEATFRLCFWARSSSDLVSPLAPHRLYLTYSERWSDTFRPFKLIQIHRALRAILHTTGRVHVSPDEWRVQVLENNLAQEKVLRRATSLPRAGEINRPYLEFLDEVVAGWRLGGGGSDGAAEVVEILYNALTHTFQSQRLLRHLIRVLSARAAYAQAAQVLRLYVEIFDKARLTDAAQVARDLRTFHRAQAGEGVTAEKEKVSRAAAEEEEFDIDSDREFIRTLLFGTRLLCKYLQQPAEGLVLARRARVIFDEKKDEQLAHDAAEEGRIERALGVALGATTARVADLETRPEHHAHALQHLETAVTLDPSSWSSQYHLAYQLFELRQVVPALEAARKAVTLQPSSVEGWHLLGLVVSAQKNLNETLLVLETGIEQLAPTDADADDDDLDRVTPGLPLAPAGRETSTPEAKSSVADGLSFGGSSRRSKKSSSATARPLTTSFADDIQQQFLGLVTPTAASPSVLLPPSADIDLPRDETDVAVSRLQIRMTRNVVIEALEGPEAALVDQQTLLVAFGTAVDNLGDRDDTATIVGQVQDLSLSTTPSRRMSFRSVRRESVSTTPNKVTKSRPNSIYSAAPSPSVQQSSVSLVSMAASRFTLGTATLSPKGNARATKLLVDLWLMSAASFRRAGRLDECRGAIAEAEGIDADNPDVWVQFALYSLATGNSEAARTSLLKSLAFVLDHPPALVVLSRLYLAAAPAKLAFAEGLLDSLTKTHGWDSAEAWFELSKCYKANSRVQREKECLVWALQLEESKSVRALESCVPRCL